MVICRLAILKGNTTRLSACTVQHYTTVVVSSREQAFALAASMNAAVCGWRVA